MSLALLKVKTEVLRLLSRGVSKIIQLPHQSRIKTLDYQTGRLLC